jgi:alpha-mannosidase
MRFEVCAHKFVDLSEGNYGVSLLNDCKYGHDIHDGVMTLSLLRCPTFPDDKADQGCMSCTYSLVPHDGNVNLPKISAMAYMLNNPMTALIASGENSTVPEKFSFVWADKENIVCETVKEAENDNDVVVRLYENNNSKTKTTISFGFNVEKVYLTDMIENVLTELPVKDNSVELTFKPFEIHTLKIKA